MKLYKDGHEAYADKEQVALFLESGWSKDKPSAKKADKVPEVAPEIEEEEIDSENEGEEEEAGEDETPKPQKPTPGKKVIRKKK